MLDIYVFVDDSFVEYKETMINSNLKIIETNSNVIDSDCKVIKKSECVHHYNRNGLYLNLINNFPYKWMMTFAPILQYIEKLSNILSKSTLTILPPAEYTFDVFKRIDPTNVKVVIIGQDPYPTIGIANGIAFSTFRRNGIPPSLQNVIEELKYEKFDIKMEDNESYLMGWIEQGVLLINSSFTVCESNTIDGHQRYWNPIIGTICNSLSDRIAILFGRKAESFKSHFMKENTFITSHPSPNSASNGFIGSNIFNRVNDRLKGLKLESVDWGRV